MDSNTDVSFTIIGDTQRTSLWERIFLFREQNDPERKILISKMLSEKPDFLVIVGDLVAEGTSKRNWRYFQKLIFPFKELNIPIYPAVGNHDYGLCPTKGKKYFKRIFKTLENSTWYHKRWGHLGLIWLDSNKRCLSGAEWNTQTEWFRKTVASMENNPSIKSIFVFCHHPPFTNSRIVHDDKNIQNSFLDAFFHSKKTVAFISGHCQSYERFMKQGKTFIVTGGGGGPRCKLARFKKSKHQDLFCGSSMRPFNFLSISNSGCILKLKVFGLEKNESRTTVIDSFNLTEN